MSSPPFAYSVSALSTQLRADALSRYRSAFLVTGNGYQALEQAVLFLKDEGYSVAFVEVAKWVHQDQSCPV